MNVHLVETALFASAVAAVSYRMKWLSAGGACVQFVLGAVLFGLGGWQWAVPVVVFFVSSSGLSHLGASRKTELSVYSSKGNRRDAMQVIANGGFGGLLALAWGLLHEPFLYGAYVAAVSEACADTWGTELGVLSARPPVLITTGRPVHAGMSGGVTPFGTCAALAGSVLVTASGVPWIGEEKRLLAACGLLACGLAGAMLDSLLGATLQAQYLCRRCGALTERVSHCGGEPAARVRGFAWIGNDEVNLVSTLVSGLSGALVMCLL